MEKLALALKARANSRSKRAREKKFFPSHSGILNAMHGMVTEVLYVLSGRRFVHVISPAELLLGVGVK